MASFYSMDFPDQTGETKGGCYPSIAFQLAGHCVVLDGGDSRSGPISRS
jgi:hypothetical protein